MKAILMSIKPKWCELIASGKKTVEVRKTATKEVPFNAYLYCTNGRFDITDIDDITSESVRVVSEGRGKVIGEFVCDKVDKIVLTARGYTINNDIAYTNKVARESCLYFDDLQKYLGENVGYAWHISDLKIYDKPKELSEFKKLCPIKNKDCPRCEFYSRYEGTCANWLTRPPQSWCYVEEIEE